MKIIFFIIKIKYMKTAIITFHESSNSGALLQAYALQTVLSTLCNEQCEIINYHSKFKEAQYAIKFNKNLLVYGNRLISTYIQKKIMNNSNSFKSRFLNITKKRYVDVSDMEELNNKYDKFFCGSDQVWNVTSTGPDGAYFLSFVKDTSKIISYAPSIAISEIPNEFKDFYVANISRFKNLSIRERSGQKLIEDIVGKKAEVVLDPTLLLSSKEWNLVAKPIQTQKKYIFLYYISYVPRLINFAKKLKSETGYDVIVAVKTVRDYINGFTGKVISPEEFITYIAKAEYVVTNSFHGMAFSINYEKEFFVFGNKKGLSKANSRITDLLDLVNLSNRFVEGESKGNYLLNEYSKINYADVWKIIDRERQKSIRYIKSALYNAGDD